MSARIVVLASGRGTNLQALMDAAAPGGRLHGVAEVVAVVSHTPTALALERARRHGIPAELVVPPSKASRSEAALSDVPPSKGAREGWDAVLAERVASHRPDVIVLAGWMRILGPAFIDRFPDARTAGRRVPTAKILNLHPALPGELPGTDAITRAFDEALDGQRTETGVMVHVVVPEVDAGPVVVTERVPIPHASRAAGDDANIAAFEALAAAIHAVEHRLIVDAVLAFLAAPPAEHAP